MTNLKDDQLMLVGSNPGLTARLQDPRLQDPSQAGAAGKLHTALTC